MNSTSMKLVRRLQISNGPNVNYGFSVNHNTSRISIKKPQVNYGLHLNHNTTRASTSVNSQRRLQISNGPNVNYGIRVNHNITRLSTSKPQVKAALTYNHNTSRIKAK